MVNKLAAGALGQGAMKKKKSRPAKKIPAPKAPATLGPVSDSTSRPSPIKGMNMDRYYAAKDGLDTLSRAAEHRSNKSLMGDIRRVAEHQVKQMNRALGGDKDRDRD